MSRFYAQIDPIFQPAMRAVASITTANPAVVTTTFNHLYKTGTVVRMYVPQFQQSWGMPQMNQFVGTITVTGPTTFTLPVDSTLFQPFAVPSPLSPQSSTYAMVVPIGEDNSILTAAVQNTLPH